MPGPGDQGAGEPGPGHGGPAGGQPLDEAVLRIDGAEPLTAETVARVARACDHAEALGERGRVIVHVSGTPAGAWAGHLTTALVSRWERALRRLERLPVPVVAVADGDCGGAALDALLATDYRVATSSVRLAVPVDSGATWPGMALYRLVNQGSNAAQVRRALLFGEPVDARAALACHLVDEVTDDVGAALEAVSRLSRGISGRELAVRRQLMSDAPVTSFEDALGSHLAAVDRALRRVAAVEAGAGAGAGQ